MDKNQRKYFPLFLDLSDKKIVIIGAGKIAKRRARVLVDFTEHLYLIAAEVNPELRSLESEGRLTILRKSYEKEDILGASYVFAATNSSRVNHEIYADCKSLGIPVNLCRERALCDFYFPVLAYDQSIVVGVSSGGKDPAGSRRIADEIRKTLDGQKGGEDKECT